MANTLTRRQRDVLKVVLEFFTTRGRLPTVRELAHELGFGSTSTAYSRPQALKRHGALRDDNGHIARLRAGHARDAFSGATGQGEHLTPAGDRARHTTAARAHSVSPSAGRARP